MCNISDKFQELLLVNYTKLFTIEMIGWPILLLNALNPCAPCRISPESIFLILSTSIDIRTSTPIGFTTK